MSDPTPVAPSKGLQERSEDDKVFAKMTFSNYRKEATAYILSNSENHDKAVRVTVLPALFLTLVLLFVIKSMAILPVVLASLALLSFLLSLASHIYGYRVANKLLLVNLAIAEKYYLSPNHEDYADFKIDKAVDRLNDIQSHALFIGILLVIISLLSL